MRAADKRQQMMFTYGVNLHVFHENDLARVGLEDCAINYLLDVLAGPLRRNSNARAARSGVFNNPSRCGILADGLEQFAERLLQRLKVLAVEVIHASRQRLARTEFFVRKIDNLLKEGDFQIASASERRRSFFNPANSVDISCRRARATPPVSSSCVGCRT